MSVYLGNQLVDVNLGVLKPFKATLRGSGDSNLYVSYNNEIYNTNSDEFYFIGGEELDVAFLDENKSFIFIVNSDTILEDYGGYAVTYWLPNSDIEIIIDTDLGNNDCSIIINTTGVTTTSLAVTQNGVYNSPPSVAYDSVTVNVNTSAVDIPQKDVNFIDYDGTILYSYTATEFAELNAMPENPSHEGLTTQGWNWSLSDAKNYVLANGKLWIGQLYITSDGETKIYINLDDANLLEPYLAVPVDGEISIDWGDNSSTTTISGSSLNTIIFTKHTYTTTGRYIISIEVVSGYLGIGSKNTENVTILMPTNETSNVRVYATTYIHKIEKIYLGSNVKLCKYAFRECGMQYITIPYGIAYYTTDYNHCEFQDCYNLQILICPSQLTYAYCRDCYSLKLISFSKATTGSLYFSNCSSLKSICLPEANTSQISSGICESCYSLQEAIIPNSNDLTSLQSSFFSYCKNLQSIIIPSKIITLNSSMFSYCSKLKIINFNSNLSITSIPSNFCRSCSSLISINIPETVTAINGNAFQQCTSLSNIILPSNLTTIGSSVFAGCYALQSITIPNTVTSIGDSAFSNCYGMLEYHFLSETPPSIASNTFYSIVSGTKIYVPKSTNQTILNAYKTATNWSSYASYIEEEPS